jgi:hypothetical protein
MAALQRPRTGRKPSMPPRSDHPGLKWRQTANGRQPYWVARQVVRDTKGFPDRAIRLPLYADAEALGELCRDHSARLWAWIADSERGPVGYDGTVRSLSRLYQQHADSPFHDLRRNTRKTYTDSLKVIENTVGNRLIQVVTVIDVKRWFKMWRASAEEDGPLRMSRAHDAISMLRTILRFGFALGYRDCESLVGRLAMVRFENAGAREQEMTAAQAMAFIRTALARGDDRGRYMAIGVAAQFELALRQKDIIGEWSPAVPNTLGAVYAGGEMWTGRFYWENIPGWRLRLKWTRGPALLPKPTRLAPISSRSRTCSRTQSRARRCVTFEAPPSACEKSQRREHGIGKRERREQRQNGSSERRQNARVINQRDAWSGQQDLNLRPGVPKTPALPGCAIPRGTRSLDTRLCFHQQAARRGRRKRARVPHETPQASTRLSGAEDRVRHPVAGRDAKPPGGACDDFEHGAHGPAGWNERF